MANTRADLMAKCPYYVSSAKRTITCEGILSDTDILSRFRNEELRDKHLKDYCNNFPNDCPVAKEIEKKYSESRRVG